MQYLKDHAPAFILGVIMCLFTLGLWNVNRKIDNVGTNFVPGVLQVIKGLQDGSIKQ